MERIEHLQIKQDIELRQLKTQVHGSIQLLNPFSSLFGGNATLETKSNLVNTAINISSQLLSRNSVLGLFQEPIKRFLVNLFKRFIN
jgi:hypothetical protein